MLRSGEGRNSASFRERETMRGERERERERENVKIIHTTNDKGFRVAN